MKSKLSQNAPWYAVFMLPFLIWYDIGALILIAHAYINGWFYAILKENQ